jgi:uroporphyrinogen-III decarboxylase
MPALKHAETVADVARQTVRKMPMRCQRYAPRYAAMLAPPMPRYCRDAGIAARANARQLRTRYVTIFMPFHDVLTPAQKLDDGDGDSDAATPSLC